MRSDAMTDADELRYPLFDVVIQRVADREIRTYHDTAEWGPGSWYYWTDGNQGCDCNRALAFLRAGGEWPAMDDERVQCGESAYRVLRFTFPDGSSIPGPEADAE